MRLKFTWAPESKRWLETIPDRMDGAIRSGTEAGANYAAQAGRAVAAMLMPVFEGWARDDLRAITGSWDSGGNLFNSFVKFVGDRTLVGGDDTHKHPAPFSYPAAKHTPGAEAHRVWLFSASGVVTEHRRKLIRWLKMYGTGYDWCLLPDAPTKDLWNRDNPPGFPPPFVEVDPSRSATDYFDRLLENDGNLLAVAFMTKFWPPVKRAWEAVV